jgi:hypothetical protein
MKFLIISTFEVAKATELSALNDMVLGNAPPGYKVLENYACLSAPFPIPPNVMATVEITECDSAEAAATVNYPLMLAGATINMVPLMEMPVTGVAELEKKYRG